MFLALGEPVIPLVRGFAITAGDALFEFFPLPLFFVRRQGFAVALNQTGVAVTVDEKDILSFGSSRLDAAIGVRTAARALGA